MSREDDLNEIKEICQEIGCSGLDPDMCQNHPHHCSIIRKFMYIDTLKESTDATDNSKP